MTEQILGYKHIEEKQRRRDRLKDNGVHIFHSDGYISPLFNREKIYRRDHYKCVYCDSTQNLTLDHLIPTSKKHLYEIRNMDLNSPINLVTCCYTCNQLKDSLSLEDFLNSNTRLIAKFFINTLTIPDFIFEKLGMKNERKEFLRRYYNQDNSIDKLFGDQFRNL